MGLVQWEVSKQVSMLMIFAETKWDMFIVDSLFPYLVLTTWRLRTDEQWEPKIGEQCEVCSFNRYCAAVQDQPEPLPPNAKSPLQIQLALNL